MNLFDKITGINSRVIPGSNKTDAFGSASNFFGTAPTNQSIMPTAYKPTQAPTIRPQVQSPVVQKQQGQISNMFSDEKKAYEAMKADGIPDEEALKVMGERRKNIRDTVGIPGINSKEEQDALNKMRADGVDAITAAGLIKQYRSQFKDLETQKFEEAYKRGNIFQKGAYNVLAGAAGNLETIAKYGGNVLDFATMGKAGFGEDVKAMEQVTQAPEFQTSSAYKAGTYLPDVALGVSPIGGGYLAGAKGALGLAGRSAVVGAGFGATQPILEKGSEATMGDIATSGAVGGVAGGVLSPVIGIAGKGIIKGAEKIGKYGTALKKGGLEGVQKSVARDISAFKAPGVETVTRNIPKAVVRRDLGFTPTERAKIEKITGQDEGTYILSKGLAGKGKEELAEVFMKQSDDMYNGITRDLSKVNAKVQSPVAKEALLDIMEQLESSPKIARAYAKDIQGVKEMLARDEFTLSELNNIRRAYDKVNTGMFTVQGKARSGLENAIDVKVRQDLSNQLQKEAKKYGVDIKAMNTELRAGLEMKDALLRRLSQEERNNFIGLQDLGVSAILSGGEPVSAVATIVAKKYAEKVAPGLSQKLYNLNKAPNVTRNVSRGNTITPRNKSSQLGLASNTSSPVVSNVVKPKVTPKKITPKDPTKTTVNLSQSKGGFIRLPFTSKLNVKPQPKQLFAGENAKAPPKGKTGWFKGADGKMRFEIDDSGAKINFPTMDKAEITKEFLKSKFPDKYGKIPNFRLEESLSLKDLRILESLKDNSYKTTFKLGDILQHDELFKQYPELKDMDVMLNTKYGKKDGAMEGNTMMIGEISNSDSLKGLILHELQHNIQVKEKFALGSNPIAENQIIAKEVQKKIDVINEKMMKNKEGMDSMSNSEFEQMKIRHKELEVQRSALEDKMDRLRKYESEGFDQYNRSAGEVEARNVQSRMGLTAKERTIKKPQSTEDVPRPKQIIRMDSKGPSMSIKGDEALMSEARKYKSAEEFIKKNTSTPIDGFKTNIENFFGKNNKIRFGNDSDPNWRKLEYYKKAVNYWKDRIQKGKSL